MSHQQRLDGKGPLTPFELTPQLLVGLGKHVGLSVTDQLPSAEKLAVALVTAMLG